MPKTHSGKLHPPIWACLLHHGLFIHGVLIHEGGEPQGCSLRCGGTLRRLIFVRPKSGKRFCFVAVDDDDDCDCDGDGDGDDDDDDETICLF